MTAMQDSLAKQATPPSDRQRRAIEAHASTSADMLRDAGVDDPLWLQVVRDHHTIADPLTAEG